MKKNWCLVAMGTALGCAEPLVCAYQPDMGPPDLVAGTNMTATAGFACRCVDQFGVPVAGVKVTLGGKTATTDAQGAFSLTEVPVSADLITLDGSALFVNDTSGEGPPRTYAKIADKVRLQAGITSGRDRPFVVPLGNPVEDISSALDVNNVVRGFEGEDALYLFSDGSSCGEDAVALRIPVGTRINFPPGAGRYIAITKIPGDLAPGDLSRVGTPMMIMLQPSGTTFSGPVNLFFPTYDTVPNRQTLDIVSLDYATADYTVSHQARWDGCELEPTSGVGISSFSFHTVRCPDLNLSGLVRRSDGQPAAGAQVVARAHRGLDRSALYDIPGASTTTGADGRYQLGGVRACAVDLVARVDLGNGRVLQTPGVSVDGTGDKVQGLVLPDPGQQRQRLDLRARITVSGTLKKEGALLRVMGAEGNVLCGRTNSAGEVLFRDVAAAGGALRVQSGTIGVNVTSLPTQAPGAAGCGIVEALAVTLDCGSGSGCDYRGTCETACNVGCNFDASLDGR